jgi:hypothetical protein
MSFGNDKEVHYYTPTEEQMRISWTVLRIAILLLVAAALAAGEDQQIYDGKWWHSTKQEQHSGWLAGYIDCSLIHGKTELGSVSWVTLASEVSKFYDSNPAEVNRPVNIVAHKVVGNLPQPPRGGKSENHSGFVGEYWRQAEPEHRLGYVQGFLVCYRGLKSADATFSKPAAWYVSEISKWFGIKPDDPGEINPKRENVFISKVLFMFKDPAPKSSSQAGHPKGIAEIS